MLVSLLLRLRRWCNIGPTLSRSLVIAGFTIYKLLKKTLLYLIILDVKNIMQLFCDNCVDKIDKTHKQLNMIDRIYLIAFWPLPDITLRPYFIASCISISVAAD